jgi:hypothetical protein
MPFTKTQYCSRSAYFYRYMQSKYPLQLFNYITRALGGCTSKMESGLIEENLMGLDLTLRYLILLDYSVNDASITGEKYDGLLNDGSGALLVGIGIEGVVRGIMKKYAKSIPNIIIIEQRQQNEIRYDNLSLAYYYRKIAAQYSLPLWSYK